MSKQTKTNKQKTPTKQNQTKQKNSNKKYQQQQKETETKPDQKKPNPQRFVLVFQKTVFWNMYQQSAHLKKIQWFSGSASLLLILLFPRSFLTCSSSPCPHLYLLPQDLFTLFYPWSPQIFPLILCWLTNMSYLRTYLQGAVFLKELQVTWDVHDIRKNLIIPSIWNVHLQFFKLIMALSNLT